MKESIGYTVSLNIAIVFIVIIFAFIGVMISYYKAFKVNNIINHEIEENEGFNDNAQNKINNKLSSLGYRMDQVDCGTTNEVHGYQLGSAPALDGSGRGYCVYYSVDKCIEVDGQTVMEPDDNPLKGYCKAENYNYVIKTYLYFNIPIINQWVKFPIYSRTNSMYACYGNNCGV